MEATKIKKITFAFLKNMDFRKIFATKPFSVCLAPMEDITGRAFRRICKQMGADMLTSEFISSDALAREVDKSIQKMQFGEDERPFGIQIFGHNEISLITAARIAAEAKPDFIDINWGCPVKKIIRKGAGAAILQNIPKMIALTAAVVKAVSLPVTVKTRLGWDEHDKPIVEVAERLQDAGIQALTIHGRTRAQLYSGQADWTLIGAVKDNPRMHIPIIGNGDVDTAEKAILFQKRYGVEAVMIGRAAIGNPWIFSQVRDLLSCKVPVVPDYAERVRVVTQHLYAAREEKSERRAVLEMRPQYAGYFKGLPDFKSIRMQLMSAKTIDECQQILTLYTPAHPQM